MRDDCINYTVWQCIFLLQDKLDKITSKIKGRHLLGTAQGNVITPILENSCTTEQVHTENHGKNNS